AVVVASPADASLGHRLIVQHRGQVDNVHTAPWRVWDHPASPCEPTKSGTVRTYRATVSSGSSDALQVSPTFLRCACTYKRGRGLAGTVLLPYPACRASHPEARPWTPAGPPGDPLTQIPGSLRSPGCSASGRPSRTARRARAAPTRGRDSHGSRAAAEPAARFRRCPESPGRAAPT